MKKLLVIILIIVALAIATRIARGEESIDLDFDWYYPPGSPQAASCPDGAGLYKYQYGAPARFITKYKCEEKPKKTTCRWETKRQPVGSEIDAGWEPFGLESVSGSGRIGGSYIWLKRKKCQ